jgi:hypothetical protein
LAGAGAATLDPGVDAEAALAALVATGMAPWDGMVALAGAGLSPALFPVLRGLPKTCLRWFRDAAALIKACDRLAPRDPVGANAWLNAYLAGRTVPTEVNLRDRPWVVALPDGFRLEGPPGGDPPHLTLEGTRITRLPAGLRVGGHLNARGTPLAILPEGLRVGLSLDLGQTQVATLPVDLAIGTSLFLGDTPLAELPDGLELEGHLYLDGSAIAALPRGLRVRGDLVLRNTRVAALPDGFEVGGDLDLRGLPIQSLPDGLRVGGNLDLGGSEVLTLPRRLRVGRSLRLNGTAVTSLPDDLEVGENLDLRQSQIQGLPDGLTVVNLWVASPQFLSLPRNLKIRDGLNLQGCPRWDGRIPTDTEVARFIETDRHRLGGIRFTEWRRLHPGGHEGEAL